MKLSVWIAENGGRTRVAKKLGVTTAAVHYWLTSRATPKWSTIYKIHTLSKGRVTSREILEETNHRARSLARPAAK